MLQEAFEHLVAASLAAALCLHPWQRAVALHPLQGELLRVAGWQGGGVEKGHRVRSRQGCITPRDASYKPLKW